MEKYRNEDGTYTNPETGRTYKSVKAIRAALSYHGTDNNQDNWKIVNETICNCKFCNGKYNISNIVRHQNSCYLNPDNVKICMNCHGPIRDYKNSKGTCSRSCSNSYFRTGKDNGNYKEDDVVGYATLCYRYHEKKCIVCGEENAVDVHHLDHDRKNNVKENLLPLCPTHHAYCHRGLFHKIKDKVDKYLIEFRSVG